MPFDKTDLEKTARLCRVALEEEEKERLVEELTPLLALAEALEGVALADEATAAAERAKMREDEVKESADREELLSSAPKKSRGFFLFSPDKEENAQ